MLTAYDNNCDHELWMTAAKSRDNHVDVTMCIFELWWL